MLMGISRLFRFSALATAAGAMLASGCSWGWKCGLARHEPYGCHDCDYVGRHVTHRPLNIWQYTPCDDLWKDHCEQAAARGSRQHSDCTVCNEAAWRGLEQHYTAAIEGYYEPSGAGPAVRPLSPPESLPSAPAAAGQAPAAPLAPIPAPLAPPTAPEQIPTAPAPIGEETNASATNDDAGSEASTQRHLPPGRPIAAPPTASPLAETPKNDLPLAGPKAQSKAQSKAAATTETKTPIESPVELQVDAPILTDALPEIITLPIDDSLSNGDSLDEVDSPSTENSSPTAEEPADTAPADVDAEESSPATKSIELPRNVLPQASSIRLLAPANRTAVKRTLTSGQTSSRRLYR
jgi:hypothetical protein